MKKYTKTSLALDTVTLHGVFLALFDKGVLLVGPSGCGKSECALALLNRSAKLICDDAPLFTQNESLIIGRSPESLQNLLEIRGLGIVDVTALFGSQVMLPEKPLDLIIEFNPLISEDDEYERVIQPNLKTKCILGNEIPHLTLSLVFSRNMAILVETAVRLVFSSSSPTVELLLK